MADIGNASAGFELRMRPRDHSVVSTQRARINALATIYCTEINKSGLAGTAAIENLQSHIETDRGCAGGAWSAWKPVTQSP